MRGDDAIHDWFGLTYASYLVMPRSVLQSMPQDWQERFVVMLQKVAERYTYPQQGYRYNVLLRSEETGRYSNDPLSRYSRGRRYVEPNVSTMYEPAVITHQDCGCPIGQEHVGRCTLRVR